MSDRERVEALAKVLGAHVALRYDYTLTPTVYRCTCGDWQPENEEVGQKSHHQHVAAMLDDAMRDLLAEAKADAWDEGYEVAIADTEARSAPPGPNGPVDPTANPYRETEAER